MACRLVYLHLDCIVFKHTYFEKLCPKLWCEEIHIFFILHHTHLLDFTTYILYSPFRSIKSRLRCDLKIYADSELLGFWTFPSSDILENRKHNVSETRSVSILK
jgi:hypothetical protein